ncbi:MAG: FG-GAP repeat protein [Bacteroidota bacterium]
MAFISIARLVRRVSPFLALAGLSAVPAVAQPSGLGPSQVSLYAEVAGPNPVQARTRAQTVQGTYEEVAEVVASIPDAGGRYGANVDLSGTRAVVGAFRDGAQNEGAAYVYDLVNGVWTLSARLTASNAVADEFFGSAVSLDGDRVLIGASGDAPLGGIESHGGRLHLRPKPRQRDLERDGAAVRDRGAEPR